jgi:hypothetical protein
MLYQEIFNQLAVYAPEIYEIFQLARILDGGEVTELRPLSSLFPPAEAEEKNHLSTAVKEEKTQEWHVDVIRHLNEMPKILKKQFLLPAEVFDHRLISRELLVRQPDVREKVQSWEEYLDEANTVDSEKRARRQKTYLLVDISGTTSARHRLLLEKAIAFKFIRNNHREKGTVFLRFFNHELSPLFVSENGERSGDFWTRLLEPVHPHGGTNLQRALAAAVRDIQYRSIDEKAEILVLTDGLADIDSGALPDFSEIKINFVIIGNDRPKLTRSELDDLFEKQTARWREEWEKRLEKNDFEEHLKKRRDKFRNNLKKEQEKFYTDLAEKLRGLAERTGGKYIEVKDVPGSILKSEYLLNTLNEEIEILRRKISPELPFTEKERILERILSLQNYINSFAAGAPEIKPLLDKLRGELKNFVLNDEEMKEILNYARLKIQLSPSGGVQEITMADLFRLLFIRLKYYFLRRKS